MQFLGRKNIIFKRCSWASPINNINQDGSDLELQNESLSTNANRASVSHWFSNPLNSFPCIGFFRRKSKGLRFIHEASRPSGLLDTVSPPLAEESPSALTIDGLESFQRGNFHEAKLKYEDSATQGDLIALHNLGTMYLHGQGILKNYKKAYYCFKQCSNSGLAASMSQLGYMCLHGRGVEKNVREAIIWFTRAVQKDRSDTYAEFHLGMLYLLGIGVKKDTICGCKWLKRSAEGGFAPALYNLAVLYMNGQEGIAQNMKLAASALKRASILQDPYAQNNLATLYANGVVVKQDFKMAHLLFCRAAKQGVSAAMFNLAEMYNNGLGVPQEPTTAAKYYLRAATTATNAEAEFNLACLFLTGKGSIEQDLNLSLHWFKKAASHGHKGARNNVQVLLTPHFKTGEPNTARVDSTKRNLKPV